VAVRPLTDADRAWARAWIEDDGHPAGLLLHRIDEGRCEVVALVVRERRKGYGRALMEAARDAAGDSGCDHVWLITTDDNPDALAFYKSLGMAESRRHLNFVDTVRAAKPDSRGYRDAIELEWR
jgi:ribosomal protein S18 acetylase RimI-like enzyme